MFGTYLRRELANRRRQTIIIADRHGARHRPRHRRQRRRRGRAERPGDRPQIDLRRRHRHHDHGAGHRRVRPAASSSSSGPGRAAPPAARGRSAAAGSGRTSARRCSPRTTVAKVAATPGVKAATGVLSLSNTTFSGQLPGGATGGFSARRRDPAPHRAAPTAPAAAPSASPASRCSATTPAARPIGPLTAATLTSGRSLTAADAGKDVAVLDSDYATSAKQEGRQHRLPRREDLHGRRHRQVHLGHRLPPRRTSTSRSTPRRRSRRDGRGLERLRRGRERVADRHASRRRCRRPSARR